MEGNVLFIAAAIILSILGIILIVPGRYIWKFFYSAVMGCASLFVLNFLCAPLGLALGINPVTGLWCGFLGVPGAAALIALKYIVR